MGLLSKARKARGQKPTKLTKEEAAKLKSSQRKIDIEKHESADKGEVDIFAKEVSISGTKAHKPISKNPGKISFLPARVSKFDELITAKGLERGSTMLVSGGAGTGKTTFCMQALYEGALKGEKGIYISLEEDVDRIKAHMLNNYKWDFAKLEKKGLIAFLKFDAIEIARVVEAMILKEKEKLVIDFGTLDLPFKPDRLVVDSLSALSIAFENTDSYRKYIRYLFEKLEENNSVNFMLSETTQDPKVYSKAGIEEFLADGVIVLYNIQVDNIRENALEILKLRSSKHEKKIVPFKITDGGLEIYPNEEIFN